MKNGYGKAVLSALLLAGAAVFAAPARADVAIGFSFGSDGGYFSDPCDYYDYYSSPPPWGLPPDYCDYPVYFEPVYYGGYWYRGPIYYRWYDGQRLFWLNGGWRHDSWRGSRPSIHWTDRGGWNRGRGDWNRGGNWNRGDWNRGDRRSWSGDRGNWSGGNRSDHNWSGSRGNWSGGNTGGAGHAWSGGNRSGGERSGSWSGGGDRGGHWSGGGGRGGWSGGGDRGGGHGGGHGGGDRH